MTFVFGACFGALMLGLTEIVMFLVMVYTIDDEDEGVLNETMRREGASNS